MRVEALERGQRRFVMQGSRRRVSNAFACSAVYYTLTILGVTSQRVFLLARNSYFPCSLLGCFTRRKNDAAAGGLKRRHRCVNFIIAATLEIYGVID